MRTVTVDSPGFQKYVQRIANDFEMPCDSVAEQQAILNEMSELKRFRQKLGAAKGFELVRVERHGQGTDARVQCDQMRFR